MTRYLAGLFAAASLLLASMGATAAFAQTADDYGIGAPGTYCPTLSTTLSRGARDASSNSQVSELQKFLADYYDIDPVELVSGYFGRITQGYVIKFQKEQGLPSFGIAGQLTRAKIATLCKQTSTSTGTSSTTQVNPVSDVAQMPTSISAYVRDGQSFKIGTTGYFSVSTGYVRAASNICTTLVRQSDGARFAFPTSGSCVSAPSGTGSTDVVGPLQSGAGYTLTPGSYRFEAKLVPISTSGKDAASIQSVTAPFTIAAADTASQAVPTCSVTVTSSQITYGQDVGLSWTSQNATSAAWVAPDPTGKDNVAVPQSTPGLSGTATVKANVTGNPSVTLKVTGPGGSNTCTAGFVVPAQTISCTVSQTPATLTRNTGQVLNIQWSSVGATSRSYNVYNSTEGIFGPVTVPVNGSSQDTSFNTLGFGTFTRKDTVTGPTGTATCSSSITIN